IVAISLLLVALGVTESVFVQRQQRDAVGLLTDSVATVRAAEEFEIDICAMRSQLLLFALTGKPEHLRAVDELRPRTGRWLAEARRRPASPGERELVARTERGYARF